MKKTFAIALIALVPLGAWAQNKDYKVELSFPDAKAGGKYIFKSKDLGENFADTVILKKDGEKVTFKRAYSEPFTLYFSYTSPGEKESQMGNSVFINGPQTLNVSAPAVENLAFAAKTGGVFDNALIQSIDAKNTEAYKGFMAYQSAAQAKDKDKADSLMQYVQKIGTEVKGIRKKYIADNPQSVYSAALLSDMLREDPSVIIPLFEALSPAVKDSKYGKTIAAKLETVRAVQPGRPAPDFALTDIEGNTLRLSDFRGKWVLLDFWGSWCGWCRKGNPALVELYEKYGGKDFEIIGLAARDNVKNWKKAIADDHLTWRHANLALTEGGNDLPARYNVSGFPTKILVDPQGNISVVSVGYHEKDDPAAVKLIEALGETYVQ